jgi:hypothetical protein
MIFVEGKFLGFRVIIGHKTGMRSYAIFIKKPALFRGLIVSLPYIHIEYIGRQLRPGEMR